MAGWIPFTKDKPAIEETKEQNVPESPKIIHKRLWVSIDQNGRSIYYIYQLTKDDIVQVGIIDQVEEKIYKIRDLKKIDRGYGYIGEASYQAYIDQNFPNMTDLEFYKMK